MEVTPDPLPPLAGRGLRQAKRRGDGRERASYEPEQEKLAIGAGSECPLGAAHEVARLFILILWSCMLCLPLPSDEEGSQDAFTSDAAGLFLTRQIRDAVVTDPVDQTPELTLIQECKALLFDLLVYPAGHGGKKVLGVEETTGRGANLVAEATADQSTVPDKKLRCRGTGVSPAGGDQVHEITVAYLSQGLRLRRIAGVWVSNGVLQDFLENVRRFGHAAGCSSVC